MTENTQGEPLATMTRRQTVKPPQASGRYAVLAAAQVTRELDHRRRRVADARASAYLDEKRETASLSHGGGAGYGVHLADAEARREAIRLEREAAA